MKAFLLLGTSMLLLACGGSEGNPLLGDGSAVDTGTGGDGSTAMDSGVVDTGDMDTGSVMDVRMDMGVVVSPLGCSDGTREAFVNMGTHKNIAGCSGGWSVAGVTTQSSMSPQCGRIAGNTSVNLMGNGCSVEDLCAAGWHVCSSSAEVQMKSGTGVCDTVSMLSSPGFWLTRQSEDMNGNCVQGGHNNILGCTLGQTGGLAPGQNCAPLDSAMWYGMCQNFPPWQCGNSGTSQSEADLVTKGGSSGGGVICCRD